MHKTNRSISGLLEQLGTNKELDKKAGAINRVSSILHSLVSAIRDIKKHPIHNIEASFGALKRDKMFLPKVFGPLLHKERKDRNFGPNHQLQKLLISVGRTQIIYV